MQVHTLAAGSEKGHCPEQLEAVRAAVARLNDVRLKVRIRCVIPPLRSLLLLVQVPTYLLNVSPSAHQKHAACASRGVHKTCAYLLG